MPSWRDLPLFVRVAVGYFCFGIVWIVASDWTAQQLAATEAQHAWFQTYKGAAFVGVSALFVGWLAYVESRRRSMIRNLLGEFVRLCPDPVVLRHYDEGDVVEANERFAREVGMDLEQVIDSSIENLDVDFEASARKDLREQLDEEGEIRNYRQTLEGDDGERPVELLVSSRRIDFEDEEYICTVAKDITDLEKAYDDTIVGWARAIELRDDETFEHTLRVTRGTLLLAEQVGVPEDELVHLRRGALLHDVGKIGVPDGILLKDDDLTDEEWEVVQKHPVFAKELLDPIDYLEPAIPIPYRHHEKWDGSGYPDGLEGEEIPLPARIFAVIDVWDALRSDRPYRDAWEAERVLDHLQEQKESHFEPDIVDAFLELGDEQRRQIRDVEEESILDKIG